MAGLVPTGTEDGSYDLRAMPRGRSATSVNAQDHPDSTPAMRRRHVVRLPARRGDSASPDDGGFIDPSTTPGADGSIPAGPLFTGRVSSSADFSLEGDEEADALTTRTAAITFLDECGIVPVNDAIDQLVEVFLPCLTIMCTRGYDPNGGTWRESGWRGMLWEVQKKSRRIWYMGWKRGVFHGDSVLDLINTAGFYYRLKHTGKPWGKWGKPGKK